MRYVIFPEDDLRMARNTLDREQGRYKRVLDQLLLASPEEIYNALRHYEFNRGNIAAIDGLFIIGEIREL